MAWFATVRFVLALLLLLSGPGSVLFWFPVHPFASFWRRVGWRWAYVAGFGVYFATAVILLSLRSRLLSVDFGPSIVTAAAGLAAIAAGAWVSRRRRRYLSLRMLLGVPELSPAQYPGTLLTEGIYARVRHPRYLEILLFSLGYALVSNYLAAYAAAAGMALGIAILIPFEERELLARFGRAYEDYRRRVPAIVPRPS